MIITNSCQTSSSKEQFLRKATQIIEENMGNSNFSLLFLCNGLCISRMHLHRKLKNYTGQSTTEFIRSIRLKRAAQLLQRNQMNVIEVMYEVGIESCSYFTKAFRNQFNITPSEYAAYFRKNQLSQTSKFVETLA